ncbi:MAG: ABC transporter ATP-binding protein [Flavobacteriales bacterium]|nr:ABC transporter ATP-binding protein [Flavobacteriales bacterium]
MNNQNKMHCIEISNLSHQFSNGEKAINNLSLQVPEGSIYGFLGKNGAGKTTTLRLLLGLMKKQEGVIKIFGKNIESHRISILKEVGSLIESPSYYAHLSAKENLKILQKIYQCSKERIDEVLKIVGLEHTGGKKVSHFSLGMKQRLSIAIALLHNPKLLILDEPTNGLDPNGIIEMRELLLELNAKHGTTIVISSHLLAEIERLITHLAIIQKGKLIYQGAYSDLKLLQEKESKISIETSDLVKTEEVLKLKQIPFTKNETSLKIGMIDKQDVASLNKELVSRGIGVYQIAKETSDLESIFIKLTQS